MSELLCKAVVKALMMELHVLDGILRLLPQDEMVCLKHGVMAMCGQLQADSGQALIERAQSGSDLVISVLQHGDGCYCVLLPVGGMLCPAVACCAVSTGCVASAPHWWRTTTRSGRSAMHTGTCPRCVTDLAAGFRHAAAVKCVGMVRFPVHPVLLSTWSWRWVDIQWSRCVSKAWPGVQTHVGDRFTTAVLKPVYGDGIVAGVEHRGGEPVLNTAVFSTGGQLDLPTAVLNIDGERCPRPAGV
jgi:hypothetical protein